MILKVLEGNDEVHCYKKSVAVIFGGRRRVLSTAPHNGGYREDLSAVFNQDGKTPGKSPCAMRAPTYAKHMAIIASEIGLDPKTSCGISTSADMENMSIKSMECDGIEVTALVTAGIDVNGGRAGDPADWLEEKGRAAAMKDGLLGTINIILHFNVDLTEGALARSVITCTEAKTAALQELMMPSKYSRGLATGSGTDGVIVIANSDSKYMYENTGKHSKLGEMIGKCVKEAVKESLAKQTDATPSRQHDVMRRTERFGITEDRLWERFRRGCGEKISRAAFADRLYRISRDGMCATYTSLYVHLMDQLDWGLIPCSEAAAAAREVLSLMDMDGAELEAESGNRDELIKAMTERFAIGILSKAEDAD